MPKVSHEVLAAALHANFYQAFLDEDSVREGIEDVKELIRAMDDLNVVT